MSWLEFFSEVSWPLVVLLGLILFRGKISALFDRVIKLGKGGAEFSPLSSQQETRSDFAKEVSKDIDSVIYENLTENQKAFLKDLNEQLENHLKKEQKEKKLGENALLKKWTLNLWGLFIFEEIYKYCFLSQLRALLKISNNEGKLSSSNFEKFYTEARASFPQQYSSYTFEQWERFLIGMGLISRKDQEIVLTSKGAAFVDYFTVRYPNFSSQKVL